MEKAAAFLESRRFGAMMGATSEFFNKMEGVAINPHDNKCQIVNKRPKPGFGLSNCRCRLSCINAEMMKYAMASYKWIQSPVTKQGGDFIGIGLHGASRRIRRSA
jgi:hypothetical protein